MKKPVECIALIVVTFLLAGCGGGAGGSSGGGTGGDPGNYFPLGVGNSWEYRGTASQNGGAPLSYTNTARITGTKVIGGVTATVISESNQGNSGTATEVYVAKDSAGITNWGNNDPADTFSPKLIPYQEVRFPVTAGAGFSQNRAGLDFGADLDGDGKNEIFSANFQTTLTGFETVTVPVGTFANCARIESRTTITITLSGSPVSASSTGVTTSWYAAGVGPVRSSSSIPTGGTVSTEEEELVGFSVDGRTSGIQQKFTAAANTAPADSNSEAPGRASITFDGTNYLLVSNRMEGTSARVAGQLISGSGAVIKTFDITPSASLNQASIRTAVAFDGSNYLVVLDQDGQIDGHRVTPAGLLLDAPSGIRLSSGIPFSITNYAPAIAFNGTDYLVVWQKFTGAYDIYGARVTPGGQALGEFPLSTASGEQISPAIASDGNNFLVLWRNTGSGSGPAPDTDIYGTIITSAGIVRDPAGVAISSAPGVQDDPHLVYDGTNYCAVWMDGRSNPSLDIYAARITAAGALLDGPPATGGIAVNTSPYAKGTPSLTFDGSTYLIAWATGAFANSPPAGIYASRVSLNGTLLSGPSGNTGISVSGPPPAFSRFVYPVVIPGKGSSLLAWVNNTELGGTSKSIEGALMYPFGE